MALAARGWGLLDALVALTVLSLGIVVSIRLQTRLHQDGRSTLHRATAIHLIHDMHNRMLFNRDGALAAAYQLDWQQTTVDTDCTNNACNSAQLAQSDLHQWRTAVRTTLPEGRARIFHSPDSPRQIGVMVAWAHNDPVAQPSTAPGAIACPSNTLCQVAYVEI